MYLIPKELLDEYNDIINPKLRDIVRASSLRRYLEGIVEIFFKNKIMISNNIGEEDWFNLTLHKKILKIDNQDIKEKFLTIKEVGNDGSHYGNDVNPCDIENAINIITQVVELLLIDYFKKYPVGTEDEVLTLLSILPPDKRVFILEALFSDGQKNATIVDKLSMAYLKSGRHNDSLIFLEKSYNEGVIDKSLYDNLLWKIEELKKHLHILKISVNIDDVKTAFNKIVDYDFAKKHGEFVNIFIALLFGYFDNSTNDNE